MVHGLTHLTVRNPWHPVATLAPCRVHFSAQIKRALQLGGERRLRASVKVMDSFSYDIIARRRKEPEEARLARGDLLSRFMSLKDSNGQPLSDQFLRDVIMNFMIAGRDTTANAMSWATYLIATHPEVETRVRVLVPTCVLVCRGDCVGHTVHLLPQPDTVPCLRCADARRDRGVAARPRLRHDQGAGVHQGHRARDAAVGDLSYRRLALDALHVVLEGGAQPHQLLSTLLTTLVTYAVCQRTRLYPSVPKDGVAARVSCTLPDGTKVNKGVSPPVLSLPGVALCATLPSRPHHAPVRVNVSRTWSCSCRTSWGE